LLFVARVAWHGYDGRRWKEDEDGSIVRPLAQKAAEMIVDEAYALDASDDEKAAITAGETARTEAKELAASVVTRLRQAAEWLPEEAARIEELQRTARKGEAARRKLRDLTLERRTRKDKAWSAEEVALNRELEEEVAAGDDAAKEAKALDGVRRARGETGWTAEETAKSEALDARVAAMEKAKKAVSDRMSARFRHAKSSAGTTKINNMLIEAAPHCARMVGDLNRERLAINCASGTIRFVRCEDEESDPDDPRFVWRLRHDPHRQADYITKLVDMPLPGKADAPHFDRFLKTIQPDPEIRAFLKRFFGYCLTGLTSEQCLVFFYGIGRNGKSTLLDLLVSIFGDYAVTLSIDSFAGESRRGGAEATPDLARLPGARLVSASEPEMGVKLKDALIKALTGGEKIPVRRLHQDFIEVDPQFKIVLSGNHKPRIDDTSDGIWRRVHMVPFDVQIPQAEVDRDLPAKLRREAPGVFAWLLEGALDYLNFGLAPPPQVLAATQDYREESDPIGSFVRNACVVTGKEEDTATPGDLFVAYSNWAGKEGAAEFRQNTFSRRFPDYARKSWQGPDERMHQFWKAKAGTTVYRGIRIRDAFMAPGQTPGGERYPEGYGG
jgi:putative DNA primase/helicase